MDYEYDSLPAGHIRLLYFTQSYLEQMHKDPGYPRTVSCCLKTVQFSQASEDHPEILFDALSYQWGDSSETMSLVCQGKVLQVHRNLYEALPVLSLRKEFLSLWIDAICINQKNSVEKMDQIRLMSRIYRHAKHVLAWLGLADDFSTTEMINKILPGMTKLKEDLKHCSLLDPPSRQPRPLLDEYNFPPWESRAWDAYHRLVYHPWFLRLWIVQEATLAEDLIFLYGPHELQADTIEELHDCVHLIRFIRDNRGGRSRFADSLPLSPSGPLFMIRAAYGCLRERRLDRDSTIELVFTVFYGTYRHECRDPQDRVMALLGFMQAGGLALQIEFDDQTSVDDLYIQFVRYMLSADDGRVADAVLHTVLAYGVASAAAGTSLPSWCPDLHRSQAVQDRGLAVDSTLFHPKFHASRYHCLRTQISASRELHQRGIIFDQVDALSTIQLRDLTGREVYSCWLEFKVWEDAARDIAGPLFVNPPVGWHGDFTYEDYWCALKGGHMNSDVIRPSIEDVVALKKIASIGISAVEEIGYDRQVPTRV